MTCDPVDMARSPDALQIPVNVVGANISYAALEDIEVSTGLSQGEPSTSTHHREQQLKQLFFLHQNNNNI